MQPFSVNGETYLHPARAAKIIGLDTETLFRWTKAGVTSYGLELTVRREGKRRLIPESQVRVMAELNKSYPLPRHGFLPADQLDDLKRAARLYAVRLSTTATP